MDEIETEIKTAIGIPSGDYESFCFDVTRDCFIELNGDEPDTDGLDASVIYEGLYRVYCVPDVGIWSNKYKNCKSLLKIKYNDWGVISVQDTGVPVAKRGMIL